MNETMTVGELVRELSRFPEQTRVMLHVQPDTGTEANPWQRGGVILVERGVQDDRAVVILEGHTL